MYRQILNTTVNRNALVLGMKNSVNVSILGLTGHLFFKNNSEIVQ